MGLFEKASLRIKKEFLGHCPDMGTHYSVTMFYGEGTYEL